MNEKILSWLDEMPDRWDVTRLKWITTRNDSGVWGDDPSNIEGYTVLRSTEQTKKGGWDITTPAVRDVDTEVAQQKRLEYGDLVVTTSSGSPEHLGKTSYVTPEVAELDPLFSNFNQRLRISDRVSPRFVYWFLNSSFGKAQMGYFSNTTTGLNNLSGSILSNLLCPLPEKTRSRKIAEYLDTEISYIDELLETLSKLREEIIDKIDSVTYQAVVKGPDKEYPTTKSGVGWIGEIPEHWDVVRTRFVAELHSGHTPDRSNDEYWKDTDIPWVTTSDIKPFREGRKRYIHETENQISELGLENSGAHLLPEGTVFLSRTASVGFSGIMGKPMATSQDFANWVCGDEILPEYLLYVFRSMDQEFDRLMQGSTHQTIYMPDIKSFKTPLPPLEEQHEIVDHIETETERLWELIDHVEETVELLEEKREALITKAVTGQIDLSDWQPDDKQEASP